MFLGRLCFITLSFGLVAGGAAAQTDLAPAPQNRPPVAAPTSQIEVAPIDVVRSMAEVINDFGGGLMQGLLTSYGRRSAMIVAAQDNRVIATRSFGCCLESDARFTEGFYSDVFGAVAVMQLVEQQRLGLNNAVSQSSNVTVAQVLTHQADPALLRQLVETASGSDFRNYVSQQIVAPLAGDQTETLPQIVGRLLVALLNEGAFEGRQIFEPQTAALMAGTHFALHPALPGWTYGFAEMQRNGWRALQWDGQWSETPLSQARIVIVPDSDLAYFILVEGRAGSSFWRALDDGLFDRILPPRALPAAGILQTPAPSAETATMVAGVYEASDPPLSSAAPLKIEGMRLIVRARQDGGLILSGGENAVLAPRPGGYWAAEDGNLNAAAANGRLILSSGIYRPLRLWKRPELYASLALMFGFAAAAAFYGERRAERPAPGRIAVALLYAVAVLLGAALFAWHASVGLWP